MNNSLLELKSIFKKYPDSIIEKIYYYYLTPLNYKIQRQIINYNYNNNVIYDYSIYSYVNYIEIKYVF